MGWYKNQKARHEAAKERNRQLVVKTAHSDRAASRLISKMEEKGYVTESHTTAPRLLNGTSAGTDHKLTFRLQEE